MTRPFRFKEMGMGVFHGPLLQEKTDPVNLAGVYIIHRRRIYSVCCRCPLFLHRVERNLL